MLLHKCLFEKTFNCVGLSFFYISTNINSSEISALHMVMVEATDSHILTLSLTLRVPAIFFMMAWPCAGWSFCQWVPLYLWAEGQLALGLAVSQSENSLLSLISPPRPESTITLLCLSPPSPWQHHMIAQTDCESSCGVYVCAPCVLVPATLKACHCRKPG